MSTDTDVLLLLGRIDERTESTHDDVRALRDNFNAHKIKTSTRLGKLEGAFKTHITQDVKKRIDDSGIVSTTNGTTSLFNGKTKTIIKIAIVIGALIGSALLGVFGVFPFP